MKNSKYGIKIGIAVFILAIIAVLFYFGLNRDTDISRHSETTSVETQAVPLNTEKVSLRLRWLTQSQFAGIYWAQEKGLFKKEGLEVTINPGGPGINFMQIVGSGAEDFGICSAPQIIETREKDMPTIAVAIVFQRNPVIFFAKKDSGIKEPKDWVGRSVQVYHGYEQETVYRALIAKCGIDPKSVKEVPGTIDMTPFFRDEVDVWSGYVINQPNTAEEKGFEITRIFPDDYGIKMSGDTLFTTERMIKEKPEVVQRMVNAFLTGWAEALKNEEEAVQIVLNIDSKLDKVHETKMMEWVKKLSLTDDIGGKVGWMTAEQWQGMIALWKEYGGVKRDIKPEYCYDMRFVKDYYNKSGLIKE